MDESFLLKLVRTRELGHLPHLLTMFCPKVRTESPPEFLCLIIFEFLNQAYVADNEREIKNYQDAVYMYEDSRRPKISKTNIRQCMWHGKTANISYLFTKR
jgi:hypothetical protein